MGKEPCQWCYGFDPLSGPGWKEGSIDEAPCPVCNGSGFKLMAFGHFDKELGRYLTKEEIRKRNKESLDKATKATLEELDRQKEKVCRDQNK